MKRPTAKDVEMLTTARNQLALALRRFDACPNRGIHLPYQPRSYRNISDPIDPVACRHGVDWTKCDRCSKRKATP